MEALSLKARVSLGVLLIAVFTSSVCAVNDAHTGLWHLLDDKFGSTVCFLVNSGPDSWRVYSGAWEPLAPPEFAEKGAFRATLPFGQRASIKVHVDGSFQGDQLAGNWEIRHIQFKEAGTWKAVRISPDPEWKPWGAVLRNRARIVNLAERLSGSVPFSSYSAFEKEFHEKIEQDYYAVLTSTLYRSPAGRYTKSFKDDQLKAIYDKMARGSGGLDTARSIEQIAKTVHEDLKQTYSWYKLDAQVLALPTGGQFDYRYFGLAQVDRRFFLVSTDWGAELPEVQLKIQLAQGLLYAALRENRSFPITASADIALRGIVARFSQKLKYSDDRSDLLFVRDQDEQRLADGFDEFRKTLAKEGGTPIAVSFTRFLAGDSRSRSYYFGYQFADRLFSTFSEKELLDINITETFLPQLNDFIADDSVKPVPLSEVGS